MRRLTWLLVAAGLLAMAAAPMLAAEEAAKPDKPKKAPKADAPAKDALRGEYAIMASECGLTEAQQTQVKDLLKARADALAAWEKTNGERLTAAREAAKKAKESGDKDAAKKANEDLKALETERTKITADSTAALNTILTAEQKEKWAAFQAYRAAMGRYKRVNPTEDQQAKIRAAAADAAKALAAVTGDDKDARKKRTEIEANLRKTIEEQILTAEQREALAKKPEKPAADAPKAEKPKAEGEK